MLIDTHVHTSGISACGRLPYDEVIRRAKAIGLDGLVLTNHYFQGYVKDGNYRAFAERYVAEYEKAHEYGLQEDFAVLYGVELTWEAVGGAHVLLYGLPLSFVLDHPTLFDYSPEKLCTLVHEAGGVLVQAHPLRRGGRVLDLRYLDGIEMNCHPLYEGPLYADLEPVAREGNKFITCGSDYHGDVPFRPNCGIFCPEGTDTTEKLRDYLCSVTAQRLRLSEVDGAVREENFERASV